MNKPKRVALLMLGVASDKCGGAERFFADFFRLYRTSGEHEVFFFIDPSTKNVLESIGRLKELQNVVLLKNFNNRFKNYLEARDFRIQLKKNRIDIVHVTNYGNYYFNRLSSLRPKLTGVKLAINIVDCEIPYILGDKSHPRYSGYSSRYFPLFNQLRPDAYYSWYELFGISAKNKNWIPQEVKVNSVTSRFSDTEGFKPGPAKQSQFVYAARLTQQKQPVMFVDAVRILRDKGVLNKSEWRFLMYGNGPEEEAVKKRIKDSNLDEWITIFPMTDLRPVFASSTCFVSTQDFENFPSLSMNEAMASGNVIVARNVGQTALFVKENVNGYLATTDDAQGIAEAMEKVIRFPERNSVMMKESVRLTQEVHTPKNFIRQIDLFWSSL
jgi:glycosyltransferase involved in cell wall biosynthesis